MKRRILGLLLAVVLVLELLPAGFAAAAQTEGMESICVDFKEFSRQAQQQSFWSGLRPAVDENTVYIGKLVNNDSVSEAEAAAYRELIDWGMDTFGWTIDESRSGFTSFWKRLYFNGQDTVPWGICMYTYYHAQGMAERSKLALTVTAPAEGWYGLDLSVFKENSSWTGMGATIGDNSGGDIIAVYVNDELLLTDYSLSGQNISVTDHFGACYLKAGENSVVIDSVLSYNSTGVSGRSNVPLQEMVFTPLTGVTVQEYLSARLDLLETYLPFNADLTGAAVESRDETVAKAVIDASGVVTVTGVAQGETALDVVQNGSTLCTIPVSVIPFDGSLDALQGSAVKVDLMAFADRAAEQDWWAPENDEMQVTAADSAVTQWLSENARWNLTDGALVIHGGSEKYGAAVNDAADIEVDIPAAGLYNINVEYLAGGRNADIFVEDLCIYEGLDTTGDPAVIKASLGAVELTEGANTVRVVSDRIALCAITFTPLNTFRVEVGREQYIDLNETYLAFDEDPYGYAVDMFDTCATVFSQGGLLTVSGVHAGSGVIFLEGKESYCINVEVVEKGTIAHVGYTADGLKAQTLAVGEKTEGCLAAMTTAGTSLAERYLCRFGNVYYLNSNTNVVSVDHTTGDITCLAEGTAVVTAYVLLDGIVVKDLVTVVVTDDTDLQTVDVTANVDYVGTGNTLQLQISGRRASGAGADMSKFPITWSVDEETLACVDETGVLTGLSEGTVTVTAAAGVEGLPVCDTITIKVVDNAALPTRDIILQLDEAKVLDWQALSFESHGFQLNKERTYKGGVDILNDAQGPRLNVPAGGAMAFDFIVKQSGWYQAYTQGKSLVSGGGMCHVYVDDSYVGFMDGAKSNSNSDAGGKMDTVWLDAGIHTIEVVASEACWIMVGRAIFYPTQDPRSVTAKLGAEKTALVPGETTQIDLAMYDQNGETWHLLAQTAVPDFTNYYILESSKPSVVSVSGNTLTAVSAGTATITLRGEAAGEALTAQMTVTVKAGSYADARLSAERTTLLPDAGDFPLTLTTYDTAGNVQSAVPQGVQVSYLSGDTEILTVSQSGIVSLTGKTGSALVTATLTEGSRVTEASLWISVNAAKTEPTVYTYEKRANAQENAATYSWARSMKTTAVKAADLYVENLDLLYDMWIPNTFPRATQVGFRSDSGYRNCRYCGVDLVSKYNNYPYIVDPIENPWKITCPACQRDFPSNDFESYYKSGLDEKGQFHKELADSQYLVNELYPEMGEGWGVDDGFGYVTKDASGAEVCHTYIAYYLASITTGLSGDQ